MTGSINRARFARKAALCLTTMLCGIGQVHAQSAPAAPVRSAVDGNGVDLFSGTLHVDGPSLTQGGQGNGIEYHRWHKGAGWSDDITAFMNLSGTTMTVSIGEATDTFTVSGSTYTSTEANGATLVLSGNIFTYTRADGLVANFLKSRLNEWVPYGNSGLVTDIVRPNGEKQNYTYFSVQYCASWKPGASGDVCLRTANAYRLANVTSSYGQRLSAEYDSNYDYMYDPADPATQPDFVNWANVIGMRTSNLASSSATLATQSFATVYNGSVPSYVVTDAASRQTKYRMNGLTVLGITRPGSTTEDVTFTYASGRVTAVTTPAGTISYGSSDAGNVRTVTVTDPGSHVTTYTFDIPSKRMTSVKDPLNNTTSFLYDTSGRLTRTTYPEGNYVQLTRDSRGNVTEERHVSKTPGTPPDVVITAGFAATCTNAFTCNQPVWTKDALGNQTDYTYDPTHGGVLTVTSPAATTGAARPQLRNTYTSLQAYYLNTSGSIVASGQPVFRLTGTSTCLTGATCTGTADEVKTTVSYGPQTAGVGNSLNPVSVTKAAGDNSLSATTTLAYDAAGNVTAVDGPLAGTADTTTYRYDVLRRPVGAIGPDPDGAGARTNAASRTTYDVQGRVTLTEQGTTAGQSDTAWAAFAPAASVATTYDNADRKLTEASKSGTTTYALTQYSYDAHGRLDCAATRMNPAVYASLPTSACTASTAGADGADRIVKLAYDANDRATSKTTAFGTVDAATETVSFTANGQAATVLDGESNLTTNEYDGHDRLVKTRFPVSTKGAAASSTTDYEQLTYDANSNVTQRRLRDGNTITFTYDNLGRAASRTPTGENVVNFTYNLIGQPTQLQRPGDGITQTLGYDALGRLTSDGQPFGAITYQYDAAGRRTRITWADGLYAQYDYDTLGLVTAIRENGATSGAGVLASYAYDSLGRRTGVTFGNGTSRSYGYDALSRLAGIKLDLAGTTNDLTIGQAGGSGTAITYNAAGQIGSVPRSNDAYAWTGHYNVDRTYTANGLNQLTQAGTTSFGYDARGNLTSSGSSSYTYSKLNELKTAPGVSLYYDASGRLIEYDTAVSTRFNYVGGMIATEFNNVSGVNTLLRRYVPGPGTDEPVVWYEGSGTTDRRWLQADERGSVLAVSDASGNAIVVNKYDEYGIPQAGNAGRFQYTGQVWLPELGMYYYKARFYSPSMGRFMQTDPIGYGDGLNWYNYVGSDPVNGVDSWGMTADVPKVGTCMSASGMTYDCSLQDKGLDSLQKGLESLAGNPGPLLVNGIVANLCNCVIVSSDAFARYKGSLIESFGKSRIELRTDAANEGDPNQIVVNAHATKPKPLPPVGNITFLPQIGKSLINGIGEKAKEALCSDLAGDFEGAVLGAGTGAGAFKAVRYVNWAYRAGTLGSALEGGALIAAAPEVLIGIGVAFGTAYGVRKAREHYCPAGAAK